MERVSPDPVSQAHITGTEMVMPVENFASAL